MDTITSNPTNPLISTSTPVFGDNVQGLLGTGTLLVFPTSIITVNSTADTLDDPNSGVTTLRDAISQANADSGEDLIVFDRSIFSTAQTITLNSGELDITHSLDIIAPLDTLTGGDLVTVSGNNASRVFEIESGATVTLSGLIVESGSVTNGVGGGIKNSGTLTLDSSLIRDNSVKTQSIFSPDDGGGIFSSGNLTVNNSTVRGNSAFSSVNPDPRNPSNVEVGFGGGIRSAGTLTLDNSTITNNLAGEYGGGIYADGTVSVSNSTISGNSAGRNSAGLGGGISGGDITVENSTISGNSAGFLGGGISGNNITVENSTISGNSATQNGGGGIYGSNITVENSTINGNSASFGGGINNSNGTLTVNNSTISGNSGSGIINYGTSTITNSTITSNSGSGIINNNTSTITNSTITSNSGSGIINNNTSTITNSTITSNSSSGIINSYTGTVTLLFSTVTQNLAANGGGVYQNDVPPTSTSVRGSFNVRNTIIASNLNSANGVNLDVSGTFTSNGYNLIGDATGSTGFGVTGDILGTTDNPIDPLLAPLAFNGGPTQTIALLPDSPAIGAADPIVLSTDPTTDQRGLPRRAADSSADIGAYELS